MDLKDLANENGGPKTGPAGKTSAPASLAPGSEGSHHAGPQGRKWLVIESRLLDGEQLLVVFEKRHLKEARKAHPDKVIYFPPEIHELYRQKDSPDFPQFLKTIHLAKKKFRGWLIPSDSPLARRLERQERKQRARTRGGDGHGDTKRDKQAG